MAYEAIRRKSEAGRCLLCQDAPCSVPARRGWQSMKLSAPSGLKMKPEPQGN